MRIAIDLSAVKTTGTKVYCHGFLPALAQLALGDDFLVFLPPEVATLLDGRLPAHFQQHIVNDADKVGRRLLWEQSGLPKELLAWRADVVFSPFDIAPVAAPCPVLLAVRNPTPLLLAKPFVESRGEFVKGYMHHLLAYLSCRKAQLIFYPTRFAARVLGDKMSVPAQKRAVVNHGTDYDFWSAEQEPTAILRHYGLESQHYVLFVSQCYPHKRPDVLVEGFASWQRKTGRDDYRLVLVGGAPAPAFAQKLRRQIQTLGLDKLTLLLGHVPGAHIPVLYQQAAAFVLPTIMETFGHPFVEAMAAGAPVICADTEFAHELCGDAALYFPADEAEHLAVVLDQVLSQRERATTLGMAGRERARLFSWEREARETLELMRQVGNGQRMAAAMQVAR